MIELNGRYFMQHDFEHEHWKVIPDFPEYMISNFSRVKRKPTTNNNTIIMKPAVLENKNGKIWYEFQLMKDGKQHKIRMDRIFDTVKFKHIHSIAVQPDNYVRYRRFSEFIYDAF
jgi:hypothetical protein